jgi:hypothetical protein
MKIEKTDILKFGFFFLGSGARSSQLYFAGFQYGRTGSNAHQIIIAEVLETANRIRKVAYCVDPRALTRADTHELDKLCRTAVSQFLGKLPMDNFHAAVLPLEMSNSPWTGEVLEI